MIHVKVVKFDTSEQKNKSITTSCIDRNQGTGSRSQEAEDKSHQKTVS
jgi:hypothetical protein